MKTITLDEQAYALLKSWKRSPNDSFSSVVKRVVRKPGTIGALLDFVESERTDERPGNERMEEAIENRTSAKEDSWT